MQAFFERLSDWAERNGYFQKDPFGNVLFLKRILIAVLGTMTYSRLNMANKLKIEGTEILKNLPKQNVLFLSNHQTYFADVIALYHIFSSVKWGFRNSVNFPVYLLSPRVNSYYVAATETMKESGIIPKIFSYAGAVTVERSWRAKGENVQRERDTSAMDKVGKALGQGWLVSFPQGTTKPFAPIRKGTAHLIREFKPLVVPVVINGFRRAFDKRGLFYKKSNTVLSAHFKQPLLLTYEESVEELVAMIKNSIEQKPPSGMSVSDEA